MPHLLAMIEERLRSRAARAGFVLSSPAASCVDDAGAGLLEYRREVAGRDTLLLDIVSLKQPPRITAELWSPSEMARMPATVSADQAAIRRRTWPIDPSGEPSVLAAEIADVVGAWLDDSARVAFGMRGPND